MDVNYLKLYKLHDVTKIGFRNRKTISYLEINVMQCRVLNIKCCKPVENVRMSCCKRIKYHMKTTNERSVPKRLLIIFIFAPIRCSNMCLRILQIKIWIGSNKNSVTTARNSTTRKPPSILWWNRLPIRAGQALSFFMLKQFKDHVKAIFSNRFHSLLKLFAKLQWSFTKFWRK